MSYDPDRHRHRSIRLRGYDYAQAGAYFLTLCTEGHAQLFGRVANGVVVLTEIGGIVAEEWERTHAVRPNVDLDAFIVMPDHLHGVIVIVDRDGQAPTATPTGLRSPARTVGAPLWLRNYYEHIIRSDADLERIRQYVATNPVRWEEKRRDRR